ncbi:hypothetical protein WAI453_001905 [Rhynchosporium graminicola]
MPAKAPAPAFLSRILGQLFVGAAGVPVLGRKCDSQTCKSSQLPRVMVEYWFPLGVFWSQIVQLHIGYHASMGPQFSLKSLRRVPDSSQSVHYAMNGNIEGLKDLFNRGLASPWDVSSTRGYTLSRWALYSKQYKTVKFLTMAGSDADYRPIAHTDNSTRNKAYDKFLQGGLDKAAEEDIRCLIASSDWINDQNFSKLHKIIVGILLLDFEEAIANDPGQVDITDAMGRTPCYGRLHEEMPNRLRFFWITMLILISLTCTLQRQSRMLLIGAILCVLSYCSRRVLWQNRYSRLE